MIETPYRDEEETRAWELLKEIDRREALELYPDFDVAYLRAAYVTPSIHDHHMADKSLLEQGLDVARRKSELLARLSCWHAWNATQNEFAYGSASAAVRYAVQALAACGRLPTEPGSMFQAYRLLAELVRYFDRRLSDDMVWRVPRHKLAPKQLNEVRTSVEICVQSFPKLAQDAYDAVLEYVAPLVR